MRETGVNGKQDKLVIETNEAEQEHGTAGKEEIKE